MQQWELELQQRAADKAERNRVHRIYVQALMGNVLACCRAWTPAAQGRSERKEERRAIELNDGKAVVLTRIAANGYPGFIGSVCEEFPDPKAATAHARSVYLLGYMLDDRKAPLPDPMRFI